MRDGIFLVPALLSPTSTPALPKRQSAIRKGYTLASGGLERLVEEARLPTGKVAPALCAGAAALALGDNARAATVLEAALADLPRIGGSHAQREVFEDSLIIAYLRSAQPNKAAPLLRSRLVRRPSARDEVWLALSSRAANGG
jgi:hypothetical protein